MAYAYAHWLDISRGCLNAGVLYAVCRTWFKLLLLRAILQGMVALSTQSLWRKLTPDLDLDWPWQPVEMMELILETSWRWWVESQPWWIVVVIYLVTSILFEWLPDHEPSNIVLFVCWPTREFSLDFLRTTWLGNKSLFVLYFRFCLASHVKSFIYCGRVLRNSAS
jgi:hypothetical protein